MCQHDARPIEIATLQLEYDAAMIHCSPAYNLKPCLFIDGNMWCALLGENLQDGVAGFGRSPMAAYADFDEQWEKRLPIKNYVERNTEG